MKKCIIGKNSYSNKNEAEKAASLGMFLNKNKEKNLILSTYKCLICYNYHLTSSKKIKNK